MHQKKYFIVKLIWEMNFLCTQKRIIGTETRKQFRVFKSLKYPSYLLSVI